MDDPARPRGRFAVGYAAAVVRLRWLVVLGWVAVVVALPLLPSPGQDDKLDGLVPADNAAIAAEIRSFEIFGFPLLSRTAMVQRDPEGLSTYAQAEALLRAAALNQQAYDSPLILGALPVPNSLGAFPGAAEQDTTVLTYLFMPPFSGFADQRDAALAFAEEHLSDPDDAFVGVTGSIPARAAQAEIVERSLPFVETATVAVIALIVALAFRSVVAPLVTLVTGGIAAFVTLPVVNLVGGVLDVDVPDDIRPVMIALLLGTVTDYVVFYLSALREQLSAGHDGRDAVIGATASTTPIVTVAGVTVAAGTGVLVVADSALFRGFGPGVALTVLIGLVVSVTLVPALMALFGRFTFWPAGAPQGEPVGPGAGAGLARALTDRRTAWKVGGASVAGLALAALPLLHLQLGVGFVGSLPDDSPVSVAAEHARAGFSGGILSPTELLLEGDGVGDDRARLDELTRLLRQQPGLASVVGPGFLAIPEQYDVFVSRTGDAARFLLVWDSPALGAEAIDDFRHLRDALPALLDQAGVEALPRLAGDTALSALIVQGTTDDLLRISVAALFANLVMLLLFLRRLVTALALLAASVLALAASLGITVLVFQDLLGHPALTFYVPFAAAVLLVALGSDYNILAVGRVWDELRTHSLSDAIRVAMPESTRAITAAALTLAVSFGLLALVPLEPFQQLAFAMVLGVLLDAVVVRTLLVPALLTILGERATPRRLR